MKLADSTARWSATSCFVIDFLAQSYGLSSNPNMKQINDQNLSFWSPQAYFIAGFFFPQQLFQIGWLYRLWKLDSAKPSERAEIDQMVDYVPFYSLGHFCIAVWMVFWNHSRLDISHLFVTINVAVQLYYITSRIAPMNTRSTSSILTHIVSKTFAGIAVVDFLHNYSAAFHVGEVASLMIKVLTGVIFGIASMFSDWIFGGSMVYDLAALSAGQWSMDRDWSNLLGLYAVGSAAIVITWNIVRPPYVSDYATVPSEEDA